MRADFAAISDQLAFIMGQLARLPSRKELAQIALGIVFGTAGLVIDWFELFSSGVSAAYLYDRRNITADFVVKTFKIQILISCSNSFS
jgi:hypothetical protein